MLQKSKMMLPVLAVIVGVAASAFTTTSDNQQVTADEEFYWFQYNEDGTAILNQATRPDLLATDPFGCSGVDINCAKAFTSYDSIQVGGQFQYIPGTPASPERIDKKDAE